MVTRALFERSELVRAPKVGIRPIKCGQTGRQWFWILFPKEKDLVVWGRNPIEYLKYQIDCLPADGGMDRSPIKDVWDDGKGESLCNFYLEIMTNCCKLTAKKWA